MTITTSRVGTVIDTLITRLKASATFADPARVYDGPVTFGDTMWTQAVFVGFNGNWEDAKGDVAPNTEYEAALINQELIYIGDTSVKETLEVPCIAEAWSGDPNTQTVRNQCLTMLAGVETVLRTDPTLGIDSSTIATMQVGNLFYRWDDAGNICARVPFTVHVLTTLLST